MKALTLLEKAEKISVMYHVFGEKYHDFREGICKNLVFLLHKRIEEAEIPRLGALLPLSLGTRKRLRIYTL